MNIFETARKILSIKQDRGEIEDFSLLAVVDMAVIVRRRLDRLEYFKERYIKGGK